MNDIESKEWEEEKEKWHNKLKDLDFPPDLQQQFLLQIQYKLDNLFTEANFKLTKYKTLYENFNDKIDSIREENIANGSNPEERRANARKKLLYYPHGDPKSNEEFTNLIAIRNNLRDKYYFYRDFVMRTIEKKDRRMDSITGISKVEVSLAGRKGAGA